MTPVYLLAIKNSKREFTINISEWLLTGKEPLSPPVEPGDLIVVRKRFFTARNLMAISGFSSVLSIVMLVLYGQYR